MVVKCVEYGALKAAGLIATEYPIDETPLLSLVKALTQPPHLGSVRLAQRGRVDQGAIRSLSRHERTIP